MRKIRRKLILISLVLVVISFAAIVLDPSSEIPSIQLFIESKTIVFFSKKISDLLLGLLVIVFFAASIAFYIYSWKGNKKAINFICIAYLSNFLMIALQWKPAMQYELVSFLIQMAYVIDGLILGTFLNFCESENNIS